MEKCTAKRILDLEIERPCKKKRKALIGFGEGLRCSSHRTSLKPKEGKDPQKL